MLTSVAPSTKFLVYSASFKPSYKGSPNFLLQAVYATASYAHGAGGFIHLCSRGAIVGYKARSQHVSISPFASQYSRQHVNTSSILILTRFPYLSQICCIATMGYIYVESSGSDATDVSYCFRPLFFCQSARYNVCVLKIWWEGAIKRSLTSSDSKSATCL